MSILICLNINLCEDNVMCSMQCSTSKSQIDILVRKVSLKFILC